MGWLLTLTLYKACWGLVKGVREDLAIQAAGQLAALRQKHTEQLQLQRQQQQNDNAAREEQDRTLQQQLQQAEAKVSTGKFVPKVLASCTDKVQADHALLVQVCGWSQQSYMAQAFILLA